MRAALACCAVLVAIGLAACGGGGDDKKDSFSDAFKPVNADLVDYGNRLGAATQQASGKTDAELARQYDGLADDLRAINKRLEGLDPPDDLKDELDGMTRDLDSAAGDLDDIAAAARRSDKEAATAATRELVRTSARVNVNQNKLAEATGADKGGA